MLTAAAVFLFSSCSNTDSLRPCPYDKFMEETITGDADYLYQRAYASLRSTDGYTFHTPENQANCDIAGTDGTVSDFVRDLFNINELASDEAICSWSDSGVYRYVSMAPNEVSPGTAGYFLRTLSGIRAADNYLSLKTDDELRRAEVRLLRALYHYYLLDAFGDCGQNVALPSGTSAVDFIESETRKAMETLKEPKRIDDSDPNYGKMNLGVARALLMRLYLNYEVYTGKPRYDEALLLARTIIGCDAYGLSSRASVVMTRDSVFTWTPYQKLFMADNGRNGAQVEAILPLLFDRDTMATYHATSYLTGSTFDQDMYIISATDTLGQTNGTTLFWGGNRTRPELIKRFLDQPFPEADTRQFQRAAADDRALFFSKGGRTMDIEKYTVFKQGYATTKFNSLSAEGYGPQITALFSNADFFLIRLAEAYLTAAECAWRQGDNATAASYVNIVRVRARAQSIKPTDITAYFLLDEWSREFYFEGRRRTDMRRFGQYFGNSARRWTWKGGVKRGLDLPEKCNIYVAPDTATVGAREIELENHTKFQKPADMYFMAGNGIVENSWDIRGGDNFGLGLIPFAANDTDIFFIDYLKPSFKFKLVGNIGLWDEQYGSGDYGTFLHNELLSEPIDIPAAGVYRVCVKKTTAKMTVLRFFGDSDDRENLSLQSSEGGVTPMVRCNTFNERCHNWMADVTADRDGNVTPFRVVVDGNPQASYEHTAGVDSAFDREGYISLETVKPDQRVRVVYNDIMRSCYFYPIEYGEPN